MFRTWPARSRLRFTPGFAACNALSFMPNLRVMPTAVSPVTTLCVCGVAAAGFGFAEWSVFPPAGVAETVRAV